MSQILNIAIAVVGIDIGKNSFHVVWPGQARCDRTAAEVVARADRGATCQHAAVPDRHGSPALVRIISVANCRRLLTSSPRRLLT